MIRGITWTPVLLDSYTISLESFWPFRGPLFRKPVTGQERFLLFLTYSKLALSSGTLDSFLAGFLLLDSFLAGMGRNGVHVAISSAKNGP